TDESVVVRRVALDEGTSVGRFRLQSAQHAADRVLDTSCVLGRDRGVERGQVGHSVLGNMEIDLDLVVPCRREERERGVLTASANPDREAFRSEGVGIERPEPVENHAAYFVTVPNAR